MKPLYVFLAAIAVLIALLLISSSIGIIHIRL